MNADKSISIALIQTDLYWKDKTANLAMLEEKIWQIEGDVDWIILPEMFPTGFTMDVEEVGEPMGLLVCRWMQQMASQTGAVLSGSAVISEKGRYYNRLLWVYPDGIIHYYDKRHLFRMAHEQDYFSAGNSLPIFEWKGWKICPQVCYDLRFPVWSRNRKTDSGALAYDVIFYVASWPAPRISAWDALLPARGIENLAYCIGVNRIGEDGNGIPYTGHSSAFDFKGNSLAALGEQDAIHSISLDFESLQSYRRKFPAWTDADPFQFL